MNMYNPQLNSGTSPDMVGARPSKAEAEAAARTLLLWAGDEPSGIGAADLTAILARTGDAAYPAFNRSYPRGFAADAAYVETLPDLQNGPESLIKGAKTGIQHVGISNFRLPVRFRTREGGEVQLETSVTGSVSLEANKKGINMSRIMRSFYKHAETTFSFEVIGAVLDSYLADLDSYDARIMMRLSYPMLKRSLRSGLEGYQYYNVALEMTKTEEATRRIVHLDYVYSSTCPCSLELSEHARRTRNQIATPHSQRSVARVSVELTGSEVLWFEDLVDLCNAAIPTETQVMVKREDEQAFAELNGSHPIFVEDAVRLLCASLEIRPPHRRLPRRRQPPGVAAQPRRRLRPHHGRDLPPGQPRPPPLRHALTTRGSRLGAARGAPRRPQAPDTPARPERLLKRLRLLAVLDLELPGRPQQAAQLRRPEPLRTSSPPCRARLPKSARQYQPSRLVHLRQRRADGGERGCGRWHDGGLRLRLFAGRAETNSRCTPSGTSPPRCRSHRPGASVPAGCAVARAAKSPSDETMQKPSIAAAMQQVHRVDRQQRCRRRSCPGPGGRVPRLQRKRAAASAHPLAAGP